ncbi:MAG: LLM class flavin-dependent oxidoreductase [Actinobacteria bacterium]|nr:LLM class flavin-dependent oxidoreductase [Actinomycetota bacterium]
MKREVGLALQTDKAPGAYAAAARVADDAGFDVVTVFNDLWYQPALPALIEIANATSRVRIGPTCLNPFTLHPVEIAGQIAALDRLSNGRAFLGLAAGAWLDSLGVDTSRPLTAVREAWEIVRRLLAGDEEGFEGARFSLPPGERLRYEIERPEVPLLVGTWSPRLAAFAGTAAAEVKIGGSANPGMVAVMRERIGNPDVGIVLGAITVVDRDGDRAREIARREVAMYVDVVGALDPTGATDLESFAFAGTPEEVADQARAVHDAGALRVDFGNPNDIGLLVSDVLPRLA